MINSAGLSQILCNGATQTTLPPVAVETLNIDTLADVLAAQPQVNPGLDVAPDQLAYVLYASGSTGTPRG